MCLCVCVCLSLSLLVSTTYLSVCLSVYLSVYLLQWWHIVALIRQGHVFVDVINTSPTSVHLAELRSVFLTCAR